MLAEPGMSATARGCGADSIRVIRSPRFAHPEVYITLSAWNRDYTSGGSSSGTAASVASGVIPISHASDGITLNATDTVYDWFARLWRMYAYTPLGNLCGARHDIRPPLS